MISTYGTHIIAKMKNVPAGLHAISAGVSCPMRYVPIQSAKPAMDIARPRTLFGYISERSTNTTAQIEIAVQNTYARKNVSMNVLPSPSDGPHAKYVPMAMRQMIIPLTPQYMSFLRPTLSMMNTARIVVTQFTMPTSTVENIGSSNPAFAKIFGP